MFGSHAGGGGVVHAKFWMDAMRSMFLNNVK